MIGSSEEEITQPREADLETTILRLVKDDPFASIGEIKREVRKIPAFSSVGWWQVFSILRKRKLLTKRSRFKFVRRRW